MIGQTSATDPEQIAWQQEQERQREKQVHDLWRRLLNEYWGRQFLYEVLLPEVGYLRHIEAGAPDALYAAVALHNLGCRWMGKYILRHRDRYLQMVKEATARDEEERTTAESKRQEWEQRSQEQVE